jgi:hypothetical protein
LIDLGEIINKSAQVLIGIFAIFFNSFGMLLAYTVAPDMDGGSSFRGHEKRAQGGMNVSIRDGAKSL